MGVLSRLIDKHSHMNIFQHLHLGVVILISSTVPISLAIPSLYAYAYDDPAVVDKPIVAARSLEQQNYRFGPIKDSITEYSDGSGVPSRTFAIEMYNETANRWENIGYVNVHLHKVNVDNTDNIDISVGTTVRINDKVN